MGRYGKRDVRRRCGWEEGYPSWLPLLWTVALEARLLLELPSTPSGCGLLREQNPRAEVGWGFGNDPEPDARHHRG